MLYGNIITGLTYLDRSRQKNPVPSQLRHITSAVGGQSRPYICFWVLPVARPALDGANRPGHANDGIGGPELRSFNVSKVPIYASC